MSGRPSAATERALARVLAGTTAYRAAQLEGIALSTIYRAIGKLTGDAAVAMAAARQPK